MDMLVYTCLERLLKGNTFSRRKGIVRSSNEVSRKHCRLVGKEWHIPLESGTDLWGSIDSSLPTPGAGVLRSTQVSDFSIVTPEGFL